MKHVSLEQAMPHANSDSCRVLEYGDNGSSDIAVIEIHGRYPEQGRACNTLAHAAIYLVNGEGVLNVGEGEQPIQQGDTVFIEPNEQYYFEGKFTMVMSCTPPWSPDQYRSVE